MRNLYRLWDRLLRPKTWGVGAKTDGFSLGAPLSGSDARLADHLTNTTDIVSFYDRDFRLTHYTTKLKSIQGNVVASGAAIWEVYPGFLDTRLRGELDRVLHGG